jgi:hypothetical protein
MRLLRSGSIDIRSTVPASPAQQVGAGGLDDVHAVEHVARQLAVIEAAVVIDGGDFAVVEQRAGEITRKPRIEIISPRPCWVCTDARQAADGVGDRGIGQLADVLGGQRFITATESAWTQRVGQRARIAGDDDRLAPSVAGGAAGLAISAAAAGQQRQRASENGCGHGGGRADAADRLALMT